MLNMQLQPELNEGKAKGKQFVAQPKRLLGEKERIETCLWEVIGSQVSFVNTLKQEELTMLRRIVKNIHFQYFDQKHGASFVTNKMIDNVIENIGAEMLRRRR